MSNYDFIILNFDASSPDSLFPCPSHYVLEGRKTKSPQTRQIASNVAVSILTNNGQ